MSDVSIRPFAWRDIPAIADIYRHYVEDTVITFETEAPSESVMADRFGKMVDLGHPVLVCERDGAVLGYAYASIYRPRFAYRFTCEDSIYLHKDAQGQGIGGQMLTRLLDESRAVGFKFDRWLDIVHMQRAV